MSLGDGFHKIASTASRGVGRPWAFIAAFAVVLAWAVSGPIFGFSDTWQLVINTGTTIITFLMVFLIQNTQNRDGHAIQLKLDELIRASKQARNRLMVLEELDDRELDELQHEFDRIAREKIEAKSDPHGGRTSSSRRTGPSSERTA
jgi:low affinity Fe/Cu permease